LGGDCCADLEERVAELEATTARKGNRKVSLTISGQVTTALMAWDDGIDNDVYVTDTTYNGGTFFQFAGNARINPNLSAGFQVVVGLDKGARTHQVDQDDDDGGAPGDTLMVMTLANWYLDHKALGRVTVGRINTATAGISTIDLGGAGVVANASFGYWQRNFFLIDNGAASGGGRWTDLLGGNTVNGASLSRANAISYTSPTVGGFSVAAAWGEDDIWDIGLRYAGEFSGFRVAAGIGYANNTSGVNEVVKDDSGLSEHSQIKGSASILHVASGLFLTGAFVDQDGGDSLADATLYYVQGGIAKNWTGLGNTVLYGEWARVDDGLRGKSSDGFDSNAVANGIIQSSEATVWGLGVVQHVDAAAMELYLSYRQFSGEHRSDITVEYDNFNVVMGGARIRF
jgi:hypothetical protein